MSSKQYHGDERELGYADAVRFLAEVCNPGRCPICDAKSWQIPMESADSPVSTIQTGLSFDGRPELELKIFCNNCGFLRSHSLSTIFSWLDRNPAGGQKVDG